LRDWWLRTLLVLQRPRPVFVALRDTSKESYGDRSEPVLAIVLLAGIAGVLATSTAAHAMDPPNPYDATEMTIWAFIAGSLYGTFLYFVLGLFVHAASKLLGSQGTYRRSRHVLAFAAVPVALSLVLWPVKLAVFGDDVFHAGGSDSGAGGRFFLGLTLAFVAWAVVLLVVGIRAVHGWTWPRALAACALALAAPVALGVALSSL
jgi:hypothetical protein